jgi:hypothetical protein
MGGMAVSVVVIVLADKVAQWEASKYFALELIVRPQQKRLRIYVKESSEDIQSTLVDPDRMVYKTTLECEPVLWEPYGKISIIELLHELTWEKRIVGVGGKVVFRGLSGIQHNKLAILTVWEPKEVKGRLDPKRLEFVPVFTIAEAPRDWSMMAEPAEMLDTGLTTAIIPANGQQLAAATEEIYKAEIQTLKQDLATTKTDLRLEQQRSVRVHGFVGDVVNSFYGAIGKTRDIGKLVLEEILTAMAAHTDITEAVKEYHPSNLFKLTRNAVIVIVAVLAVVCIMNADVRAWISQYIVWFILAFAAAVILIFYLRERDKR